MSTTVEHIVWLDTIEPGTIMQWRFYGPLSDLVRGEPEWVTVLAVRRGKDVDTSGNSTVAIVERPNGTQDVVQAINGYPVRIRVDVPQQVTV